MARPRPVPGDLARARFVRPVEAIEDLRQLVFGNARPRIGNFDPGRSGPTSRRARRRRPRSVNLMRVVDQIARRAGAAVLESPIDRCRRRLRTSSVRFSSAARWARAAQRRRRRPCASETGSLGMASPRSALASVSMPLTMLRQRRALVIDRFEALARVASSRSPQRSSICALALIEVSGVLSSCDASEMNCRSRAKASSSRASRSLKLLGQIADLVVAVWPVPRRRSRRSDPISRIACESRLIGRRRLRREQMESSDDGHAPRPG